MRPRLQQIPRRVTVAPMLQLKHKWWKYLLGAVLLFVIVMINGLIIGYILINQSSSTPTETPAENTAEQLPEETQVLDADLLGKGYKQKIVFTFGETDLTYKLFDNGEVVMEDTQSNIKALPPKLAVIQLDTNKPQEFIRWDTIAGPHHSETVVFQALNGRMVPMMTFDYENEQFYMPFWSSRGDTLIYDINGDGKLEVLEFVDEFPPDAPRLVDSEIERITKSEFEKQGLDGDAMWKIVSRENEGLGRGRQVVWNVYELMWEEDSMPAFRKVTEKDKYEIYTSGFIQAIGDLSDKHPDAYEKMISRYDLTQDSIDFNLFVRDFWTSGNPYEEPFSSSN